MSKPTKMGDLLDDNDQDIAVTPAAKVLPPEPDPVIDASIPKVATVVQSQSPLKKIPDLRGKKIALRERLYESLGISRKFTPRLTRRRTAIYQLVNMKGRIDARLDGVDKHVDPPQYDLVPNYTFTDTDEPDLMKREKTMTFFEGGTETVYVDGPVKGKPIPMAIPKIGSPAFINGQMTVNIYNQYPQYAWLELHPRNASNKWRDQGVAPIFERVDTKYDSPHVANIRMDMKRDAETYVISLKPDQLMNLAARLTNPTVNANIDPQQLKLALRMRAQQNPEEILYTNPDNLGSIKIACIHALDLGSLTYVPENEAYYMEGEEPIFQVPVGSNPFEALVEFFNSHEGREAYQELKEEIDFWF